MHQVKSQTFSDIKICELLMNLFETERMYTKEGLRRTSVEVLLLWLYKQ